MRYDLEQFDRNVFRAYDIRGVVGKGLSDALVYHLGRAFASQVKARGGREVVVGADGRLSSPHLKELLTFGLLDGGVDVADIGFVPTPVLYFAAYQTAHQNGIMITGSHNPPDYNGFKLMLGGVTLSGDEIQTLRQAIEDPHYSEGHGERRQTGVNEDYLTRITDDLKLKRHLKVVVDCGNGIPGKLAPTLFKRLGCEVDTLYCDVDGTFPNHHPDPSKPENLRDLIARVKETGADIGIAFDGDGDRLGVVTDQGHIVYPDRTLMLLADDLLHRVPGATILYDVKCSRHLPEVIRKAGGQPLMGQTGHSLMKAKMKASGAALAGEMSGHIFFKERWFGFDDGLYSAARLLEVLALRNDSADAIFNSYPEDISTPELHIPVPEEDKFTLVKTLSEQDFPGGDKVLIDGVRVDYADGWGLVRASNTTPVLVLRFEAESQSVLKRIRDDFQSRLSQVAPGLTIPSD